MIKVLLLLITLSFLSCGHKVVSPSARVANFIDQWSEKVANETPKHREMYTRYLTSVENVLKEQGQSSSFDFYLSTLKANTQVMMEREARLPEIYQAEKKGRSISSSDYSLYKTNHLTRLYDNLYTQREIKLKEDLGNETFQKLRNNHASFNIDKKARPYAFPL